MTSKLLPAAALLLLPLVPVAAQRAATAPAAAAKSQLSAEQSAEVQQALTRGRALAVIEAAGRMTTRDMLGRIPNASEAGIDGWIAQPEGNGVTVTYYGKQGEAYEAIYRSQLLGGRVTSPQVFAAGSRPALTGIAARMAAARSAAAALDNKPCNGPAFNYLVLPPRADGPVLVYQVSPRMTADKVPAGGHYRATVAADGKVADSAPLGTACADLQIPASAAGQQPRPLVFNAGDAAMPNELHVFMSLWTRRPVVVATSGGGARRWGVTGESITALQQ